MPACLIPLLIRNHSVFSYPVLTWLPAHASGQSSAAAPPFLSEKPKLFMIHELKDFTVVYDAKTNLLKFFGALQYPVNTPN